MAAYKHLKLWTRPDSYIGASWPDYYVVIGQHRDSDRVARSNFIVAKQRLEAIAAKYPDYKLTSEDVDNDVEMLINPYESHWAVGHVEWIGIHQNAPSELLDAAEDMLASIADYPLLDDSHHSELEWTEATEYWERASISERLDWIQRCEPGMPCFAARHDLSTIMHEYSADHLWEAVTND